MLDAFKDAMNHGTGWVSMKQPAEEAKNMAAKASLDDFKPLAGTYPTITAAHVPIRDVVADELQRRALFPTTFDLLRKYAPMTTPAQQHPLYPVLMAAIDQAMNGKGERHGGAVTPFMLQPWFHYAKMHGRGFLTGQAAKKLEEAASKREGQAFEQEMLGAIVYTAMAIINERAKAQATV